ncbi:MAG: hypothetical protein HN348_13595 [Proteobacteria bacterium]|nr:hypothetical protein [Pseudomonadota bacterium]
MRALPAVQLDTTTVAVVAADRSCRPIADRLVQRLNEVEGLRVDPQSEVRLNVNSCGESYETSVFVNQEVSSGGTISSDRRRAVIEGRGHAVVTVQIGDDVQAHIIGSGNRVSFGTWHDRELHNTLEMRQVVQRRIGESVADDLAEQLSPVATIAARRVFPNAPLGSARQLHTLAVQAEQSGDIQRAREFAQAALAAKPTTRERVYIEQLDRLIEREIRQLTP